MANPKAPDASASPSAVEPGSVPGTDAPKITIGVDPDQTPFVNKAGKPKQDNPYLPYVTAHKDDQPDPTTGEPVKHRINGLVDAAEVKRVMSLVRRAGSDVDRSILVELVGDTAFRFVIVPKIVRPRKAKANGETNGDAESA